MNKILIVLLALLITVTSYAQQPIQYSNSPFASIAIGYRKIFGSSLDSSDQASGAYRLALGYYFLEHKSYGLSAELGIMNEERVKMDVIPDNGVAPNMTLKSPIDLLVGAHFYYKNLVTFAKAGAAYEQVRFDYPSFNDENKIVPEIQAGIGWLFSKHAEADLFYQHTFGKDISIQQTSPGYYSTKDNVPSVGCVFLAFVWRLA